MNKGILMAAAGLAAAQAGAQTAERPNIVFIMADDLANMMSEKWKVRNLRPH